jgi:hypothetical protein
MDLSNIYELFTWAMYRDKKKLTILARRLHTRRMDRDFTEFTVLCRELNILCGICISNLVLLPVFIF